jgi:hypothetical protein
MSPGSQSKQKPCGVKPDGSTNQRIKEVSKILHLNITLLRRLARSVHQLAKDFEPTIYSATNWIRQWRKTGVSITPRHWAALKPHSEHVLNENCVKNEKQFSN